MKLLRFSLKCLPLLLTFALAVPQASAACAPTGFVRDGINLTAALINPRGVVSGDVDATGCNIGVYYGTNAYGVVNNASIHSANYYGVVNNGAFVTVENSTIYDIGETPLNGDQHGVGIYWAFQSNAHGDITGNVLWNYQKGGIVVNGPTATSNIANNTVIGQGPVNYIAQNGIQVGYGAQSNVTGNMVTGNSYTGAGLTASGGIILVGGDCYGGPTVNKAVIGQNIVVANDIGVWFSNLDANCNPVSTPTRDVALKNTIRDNAVSNTTGDGATQGYQAGVSDQGDQDEILSNSICGIGYTSASTPTAALFTIDVTATNNPVVKGNTTCSAIGPVTDDKPGVGFPFHHSLRPDHHR